MPEHRFLKPKRQWAQFRLSSLLGLFFVLSVPLAWLTSKLDAKRKERGAVAAVHRMDGQVWYDYQLHGPSLARGAAGPGPAWIRCLLGDDFFARVERVAISNRGYRDTVSDEELNALRVLRNVRSLSVYGPNSSDAGLAFLDELTELEDLTLYCRRITGVGLRRLTQLTCLRRLHLMTDSIDDTDLVALHDLTTLEELYIGGSDVSGDGLTHLGRLGNLRKLELQGTDLSDADLANLRGLSRLAELHLFSTRLTDAGLKEFRKALPACKIIR